MLYRPQSASLAIALLALSALPSHAITLAEAVTATTTSGYSVVGVRAKSSSVSVLATDGTTYYEISYDSTGTASTREVTLRDDAVLSGTSSADAAVAAAEAAGYTVLGLRTSADGSTVSMRATDGTTVYEVSYDTATATTTTTEATAPEGHGRKGGHEANETTDTSTDTDTGTDTGSTESDSSRGDHGGGGRGGGGHGGRGGGRS